MDEIEDITLLDYLRQKRAKGKTKRVFAFTLDPEVVMTIDRLRGNTPRSRYVNNILRRWIEEHGNKGYQ